MSAAYNISRLVYWTTKLKHYRSPLTLVSQGTPGPSSPYGKLFNMSVGTTLGKPNQAFAPWATLTFDLQLAVHLGLPQVVDGLARVEAAVVRAGLPDLQSAHPLIAKHAVARVVHDGYLVLHPDHFRLQSDTEMLKMSSDKFSSFIFFCLKHRNPQNWRFKTLLYDEYSCFWYSRKGLEAVFVILTIFPLKHY